MMGRGVGLIGPFLLWIGLFFITFDTFPVFAFGFTKVLLDGLQRTFPRQVQTYENPENHPAFNWIQIGALLILPLIFSLPMAPSFIALTIAGNGAGSHHRAGHHRGCDHPHDQQEVHAPGIRKQMVGDRCSSHHRRHRPLGDLRDSRGLVVRLERARYGRLYGRSDSTEDV